MRITLKKLENNILRYKDRTPEDVVDLLNKKIPISLKYNEDIINRIHAKYPLLSKTEISVVVLGVFQTIRDLLILNKEISVNGLFNHFRFIYGGKSDHNRCVSYFLRTPKSLRNIDNGSNQR